jgi:hypothetical protein
MRENETGFTFVELIIGLLILTIALLGVFDLASRGIKDSHFIQKLSDVQMLSAQKAAQVLNDSEVIFKALPAQTEKVGSIAPQEPVIGYSDLLDYNGRIIDAENQAAPKFIRQWMLVKNHPSKGDLAVYCSVVYKDTNKIIRIARSVKVDGMKVIQNLRP